MKQNALKQQTEKNPRIETASGASAEVDDEQIVVRDPSGALALVCSMDAGGLRITIAEGNLTLAAPNGAIRLEAGGDIDLATPGGVRINAREAEWNVEKWALRAGRIIEEAIDVYRVVDDLLQTRAGRVRSLVKGAYQLFSHRTTIASEEDTVVDGKRVLLG